MNKKVFDPEKYGMVICPTCDSNGYIQYPKRQCCSRCGGFGFIIMEPEQDANIPFTRIEQEVLNQIVLGCNDNEIEELLHTNGRIIQQHKTNVVGKTNLPDISSAIQYALGRSLVRITYA